MGPHNFVHTILRCQRHHSDASLCVNVDREVPEPLRCTPGGGGGGSILGGLSPCTCGAGLDLGELRRRVAEAMRRGLGEWIRLGAVVIVLDS